MPSASLFFFPPREKARRCFPKAAIPRPTPVFPTQEHIFLPLCTSQFAAITQLPTREATHTTVMMRNVRHNNDRDWYPLLPAKLRLLRPRSGERIC